MPIIVAEAKVQSKSRRRLPGILYVNCRIRRVFHAEGLEREVAAAGTRVSEQVVGKPVSCVLSVEGEIASGRKRGVLTEGRSIVDFIPKVDGVFAADQTRGGLRILGFHPEPAGIPPWSLKAGISGYSYCWQTRGTLASRRAEALYAGLFGEILDTNHRRRKVVEGVHVVRTEVDEPCRRGRVGIVQRDIVLPRIVALDYVRPVVRRLRRIVEDHPA